MVSIFVKADDGSQRSGVSLKYETEAIPLNHIFYTDCSDYHYRVIGFFTGVDHWGESHHMAEVEPFLRRDTKAYLAAHGLGGAA